MSEDKTSTSAEHLKGSVKEAIGKLTGDARVETEGRRQKRGAPADPSQPPEPETPTPDRD